jgi:hypothetical protein
MGAVETLPEELNQSTRFQASSSLLIFALRAAKIIV